MKVVKSFGTDVTEREPLWALAIRFAIANPSPVPPALYVTKGSKMLLRFSGRMPQPLSDIFAHR